jgi:ribonuclease D
MSNWEVASLSQEQQFYAAQDAYTCIWLLLQLHGRCALPLGAEALLCGATAAFPGRQLGPLIGCVVP